MRTIVTLAAFLLLGFIGSRGFVRRILVHFPFAGFLTSGTEFFVLGMIAGPSGVGLITPEVMGDLEPIVFLVLGWVGMLFGIDLSWRYLRHVSRGVFRFLLLNTILSIVVFGGMSWFLMAAVWPDMAPTTLLVACALIGITGAVSSPTVVALVGQRLRARGPRVQTAGIVSALSPLFPLIVFGMLFMVLRPAFFSYDGVGAGPLWWMFFNVTGIVLGFAMTLFALERATDDEMLVVIIGTVLLIGGICYFLRFSSLYTSLLAGAVAGNLSRRRDQIFRELHVVEKPIFVGLVIMVGASVQRPDASVMILVGVLVLARILFKRFVTGPIVARTLVEHRHRARHVATMLTGQGAMAMAIALDGTMSASSHALGGVLTVIAVSALANDVVGAVLTRRALLAAETGSDA